MFKSQKVKRKLFYFFFLYLVTVSFSAKCIDKNISLVKADSLFAQKKFTEALEIYTSLEKEGVFTSSMYLKMAYINEALDNIPGTLYFLNKYYLDSRNKLALKKMETLASKYGIEGYDYSDKEFLENLVFKYGSAISFVIVLVLVVLFALLLYRRMHQKKPSIALQVSVLVLTIIVMLNSNIKLDKKYGIVNSSYAFLMSSPSSGSEVLGETNPGNRFLVNGGNDVWLKMKNDEESGYMRKIDLLLVQEKQPIFLWLLDKI